MTISFYHVDGFHIILIYRFAHRLFGSPQVDAKEAMRCSYGAARRGDWWWNRNAFADEIQDFLVPNTHCLVLQCPTSLFLRSPFFHDFHETQMVLAKILLFCSWFPHVLLMRQTPLKRQQWPGIQQRSIIALDRAPRWCCWDGKRN